MGTVILDKDGIIVYGSESNTIQSMGIVLVILALTITAFYVG